MRHEPEFSKAPAVDEQTPRELAACYARVFLASDDGKRVLADLRRRFGIGREVFTISAAGRFDTIAAAKADGQRDVMRHVESALLLGAPTQAATAPAQILQQPKP